MKDAITVEPPLLESELRELRLPTMMSNWKKAADAAAKQGIPYSEYLADLVHHEIVDRHDRRVSRRVKEAKFPSLKTLDTFDFDHQPGIKREKLLELARGDFVTRHENVVLLGEIGTGKTHLASAIGFACCQRGLRVRFMTAADLTTVLVESKSVDRLSRKLDQLARYDLVILDELGYVRFAPSWRRPSLHVRYSDLRAAKSDRDDQSAVPALERSIPGCDGGCGSHRPGRSPLDDPEDGREELSTEGGRRHGACGAGRRGAPTIGG